MKFKYIPSLYLQVLAITASAAPDGNAAEIRASGDTAIPDPHQSGTRDGCSVYYCVLSGDTCAAIASKFGITINEFISWNPDVGLQCANLWAGYNVCVRL
ncbi:hypothetical protein ASPZODRAFT_13364 [Penicilliopsis zonata CBS 506.65]|uniref:LysM domain-containing protein n=1 Tax=Penicilliopsis zonata CBS 506.65 TaxID=1073090 RepID=A0A1L9SST7_9EURO|nr:hypothetical protein ASPZODRAFT_13364 [Penicilliopsis zonata CBS 506.65]OJJ50278.1 hypothetical protein ASPZODRAFT_13364 [Penicilliopsis zonata CBS 506.65]